MARWVEPMGLLHGRGAFAAVAAGAALPLEDGAAAFTLVRLIEDGKVQQQGMRRADMSEHDLEQALRMQGQEADPAGVERAYLERGGSVSVIPAKSEPRVLEVRVEDGVQTVRIKLK